MEVRLEAAGLIRKELDDYELPLNPLQNPSQRAIGGCLVRLHHLRSKLLMIKQSKNGERRKQNAEQRDTSGFSKGENERITSTKLCGYILITIAKEQHALPMYRN